MAPAQPNLTGCSLASLPEGVVVTALQRRADERGAFTEIFRATWPTGIAPIQWNAVSSAADVLRGFHVHFVHHDYLVLAAGRMTLGLKDLRPDGRMNGIKAELSLDAARPVAVSIPPGVGHGFYFPVPSLHVYAVSEYWNTADELACRWDDPDLGLLWPTLDPNLSERDRTAGSFAAMAAQWRREHARHAGA